MRDVATRFGIAMALLVPVGGFALLFGWLGVPYESTREELVLIYLAGLATVVLLTAGWAAWRRLHGRSVKGPLWLGVWLAGGCAIAILLALAGVHFDGRKAASATWILGMLASTVVTAAVWLIALFVRVNVDWIREERRRGGVFR